MTDLGSIVVATSKLGTGGGLLGRGRHRHSDVGNNPLFAHSSTPPPDRRLPSLLVRELIASELMSPAEAALAESMLARGGHSGHHHSPLASAEAVSEILVFAKERLLREWRSQQAASEETKRDRDRQHQANTTWLFNPDLTERGPLFAISKRPNRFVRLVPATDEGLPESAADAGIRRGRGGSLEIFDSDWATLLQPMHQRCPCLSYMIWAMTAVVVPPIMALSLVVSAAFLPIALFEMTNTTDSLFMSTTSAAAVNSSTALRFGVNDSAENGSFAQHNNLHGQQRPWSPAVAYTSTISLSCFAACCISTFFWEILLFANATMLRRLWRKEWPAMVVKIVAAWGYAATASTIQPHAAHVLWVMLIATLGSSMLVLDAVAVTIHLRFFPPVLGRLVGSRKQGKQRNSCMVKMMMLTAFVIVVFDCCRHLLVTQISSETSVVSLNFTNPFTGGAVVYTNLELASALFWTTTIFLMQSIFIVLTKKAFRYTLTDIAHYEIVGPEAGAPPKLVLVRKGSPRGLVLEHAEALARGETSVPLTLKSHPGKGIVPRYADVFSLGKQRRALFLGVGDVSSARDSGSETEEGGPLMVKLEQQKFVVCISSGFRGFVLSKPLGGTAGKGMALVAGPTDTATRKTDAGREFSINAADGSVSPADAPGMVLGV